MCMYTCTPKNQKRTSSKRRRRLKRPCTAHSSVRPSAQPVKYPRPCVSVYIYTYICTWVWMTSVKPHKKPHQHPPANQTQTPPKTRTLPRRRRRLQAGHVQHDLALKQLRLERHALEGVEGDRRPLWCAVAAALLRGWLGWLGQGGRGIVVGPGGRRGEGPGAVYLLYVHACCYGECTVDGRSHPRPHPKPKPT